MPMSSELVEVLGTYPITYFGKHDVRPVNLNASDVLGGNPAPTIQVNVKVVPGVQGDINRQIKKSLEQKAKSGYLAQKLQERFALLGIQVKEYQPAWLKKLTMMEFSPSLETLITAATTIAPWPTP